MSLFLASIVKLSLDSTHIDSALEILTLRLVQAQDNNIEGLWSIW